MVLSLFTCQNVIPEMSGNRIEIGFFLYETLFMMV